jgi:hypothetical protein
VGFSRMRESPIGLISSARPEASARKRLAFV